MARKKSQTMKPSGSVSRQHLDAMIEKATVDCNDELEQISGLFTMLEENLALPFNTALLGVDVTVEEIDLNDAEEIVAICKRGSERQRVSLLDLPLPEPKPAGTEWIEAYRRWAKGRL